MGNSDDATGLSPRTRACLIIFGVVVASFSAVAVGQVTTNEYHVGEGTSLVTQDGLEVVLGEDIQSNRRDIVTGTEVDIGDGITTSAEGDSKLYVRSASSGWVELYNINATNTIHTTSNVRTDVSLGGGVESTSFGSMEPNDGDVDFTYTAEGSQAVVTVHGLQSDETYAAVDDETGNSLDNSDSDSSGSVAFTLPEGSYDIRVSGGSDDSGGSLPSLPSPVLTDPQPEGDQSYTTDEISVHVDDDYFPNNVVHVEFFVDGESVGNDTVNDTGRARTNVTGFERGRHTARAVATNDFDRTTELTWEFGFPHEFHIYNATEPYDPINDRTVNVRFEPVGEDEVYDRETDNATVDMEGLPTTDFIVSVSAEGYHDSTVHVPTITSQDGIYLINENETTVDVRYVLEDETGTFGTDSRLNIKRAINQSGTNRYRTVHTDQFGVEGVTATLLEGERYRLELVNREGTTQSIGPYRAEVSETVTVRPSEATLNIDGYEDGWAADATRINDTIVIKYDDPENLTQRVDVKIHERNNPDNMLTGTDTFISQQEIDISYELDENESQKEWVVQFEIEREDGSHSVTAYPQNRPDSTFGAMGDVWRTIFGVAALLIFGGIFSVVNKAAGGLAIGAVGGVLWWTGWLSGATTGVAVMIYLTIAAIYAIHSNRA